MRSLLLMTQKDTSASAHEAADILPELPDKLRQDVLWVTQESLIESSYFLRVWASADLCRVSELACSCSGVMVMRVLRRLWLYLTGSAEGAGYA